MRTKNSVLLCRRVSVCPRPRRYLGKLTIELHDSRLPDTRSTQHDILISSPPYGDNITTVPYGQNAYLPLQWIDLDDIEECVTNSDCLQTTHEIDRRSLGGSVGTEC